MVFVRFLDVRFEIVKCRIATATALMITALSMVNVIFVAPRNLKAFLSFPLYLSWLSSRESIARLVRRFIVSSVANQCSKL